MTFSPSILRGSLLLAPALLLLSACESKPPASGRCTSNEACEAGFRCDPDYGECVPASSLEDGGEGSTADAGHACAPACAPWHTCTEGACEPVFTALALSTPAPESILGGESVVVRAHLERREGQEASWPDSITLSITPPLGAGDVERRALVHEANGEYAGAWPLPQTDGRYVLRATFEPGGLTETAEAAVRVDRTPPQLDVDFPEHVLPSVDAGSDVGRTVFGDSEVEGAWAADELLSFTVSSDAPDLVRESVRLQVESAEGGIVFGPVALTATEDCAPAFCAGGVVELWQLPLEGFRASFNLVIEGLDGVGNLQRVVHPFWVTRQKWVFTLAGDRKVSQSPALGRDGTLWVGTTGAGGGHLIGLRQQGSLARAAFSTGAVAVGPMIARNTQGVESIFLGASAPASKAWVINAATGASTSPCAIAGLPESALAWMDELGQTLTSQTALFVSRSAAAVAVQPGTSTPWKCTTLPSSSSPDLVYQSIGGHTVRSTIAVSGSQLVYGYTDTKGGGMFSMDVSPLKDLWTAQGPAKESLAGVAIVGDQVLGTGGDSTASNSGLYLVPRDASGVVAVSPVAARTPATHFLMAVGKQGTSPVAFLSSFGSSWKLRRVDVSPPSIQELSVDAGGALPHAGVLGAGGRLYTAAAESSGVLTEWDALTLSPRWTHTGLGAASAPLSLDCARQPSGTPIPGRPGVLYVPAGNKLFAIVVASPGLDTTAPWPRYQRDPGNTGNVQTDLSEYACP